eukprot:UN08045
MSLTIPSLDDIKQMNAVNSIKIAYSQNKILTGYAIHYDLSHWNALTLPQFHKIEFKNGFRVFDEISFCYFCGCDIYTTSPPNDWANGIPNCDDDMHIIRPKLFLSLKDRWQKHIKRNKHKNNMRKAQKISKTDEEIDIMQEIFYSALEVIHSGLSYRQFEIINARKAAKGINIGNRPHGRHAVPRMVKQFFDRDMVQFWFLLPP